MRIGAHGALEIAGFLQYDAEIERGFAVVRLYLDRLAVGLGGAIMVAHILADEAEIEPDRRGSLTLHRAFKQTRGQTGVAILPCQPSQPGRGLDVLGNDVQDRPPRLPRLRPKAGLIERSGLFQKCLPLRRDRDGPIEMRQCAVKIADGAGDARREQARGRVVRPPCKAGLDVTAG